MVLRLSFQKYQIQLYLINQGRHSFWLWFCFDTCSKTVHQMRAWKVNSLFLPDMTCCRVHSWRVCFQSVWLYVCPAVQHWWTPCCRWNTCGTPLGGTPGCAADAPPTKRSWDNTSDSRGVLTGLPKTAENTENDLIANWQITEMTKLFNFFYFIGNYFRERENQVNLFDSQTQSQKRNPLILSSSFKIKEAVWCFLTKTSISNDVNIK